MLPLLKLSGWIQQINIILKNLKTRSKSKQKNQNQNMFEKRRTENSGERMDVPFCAVRMSDESKP